MIFQAVGLGIMLNFLYTEFVGLTAGGLITPGYIAFFWNQPFRIVVTFIVAILTYYLLRVLSNFVIIYSRRSFMAAVIIGYILGWVFRTMFIQYIPVSQDLRVIGYIVPGLIANSMIKQGIINTMISVLFVSTLVRLILLFIL